MTPQKFEASSLHTAQVSRLLATENLSVEVGNFPTAWFNVQTRVLGLPNWNFETKEQLDLLISHEVGHALWTPEGFMEMAHKKNPKISHGIVNIVEDIRIERMIQDKYPGLYRTYREGYSIFFKNDLFKIADQDLEDLKFLDRLNLQGKLGKHIGLDVPMSEKEMDIYERCYAAETIEDVIDLCDEIWHFIQAQKKAEPKKKPQLPKIPRISPKITEEKEEEQPSQVESDEDDSDDDLEDTSSEDEAQDSPLSSDDEDKAESDLDNTDSAGSSNQDEALEEEEEDDFQSNTQSSFDSNVSAMTDSETIIVKSISIADVDKIVYGYDELKSDEFENECYRDSFKKFLSTSQREVDLMVKEFNRKKSAKEYSRGVESDSGCIDVNKLHSYKFDDKIFASSTYFPNGQSHGMLFFLDRSGSMSGEYTKDTIFKTISLVRFCQRSGIKFKVYTYTSADEACTADHKKITREAGRTSVFTDDLRIVERLSSDMSPSVFNRALFEFYALTRNFSRDDSSLNVMGATPIASTTIVALALVEKYKKIWGVQKMNFIMMTDGDSNNLAFNAPNGKEQVSLYNKKIQLDVGSSRLNFKIKGVNDTIDEINEAIQKLNCTTIGFNLLSRNRRGTREADKKINRFLRSRCAIYTPKPELINQYEESDCLIMDKICGYRKLIVYALEISHKETTFTKSLDTSKKRLSMTDINKLSQSLSTKDLRKSQIYVKTIMETIG